jgi:hypothetical protein
LLLSVVLIASDVAFHASKITPTYKYANLHEPNGMTKLLTLPSNSNKFITNGRINFGVRPFCTFNRSKILSYNTITVLILTTIKSQPVCPDLQDTEEQVRSSCCPNVEKYSKYRFRKLCKIPKTASAIYMWWTIRAPFYIEPANIIKISAISIALHGHHPISVEVR